MTREEEKKNRTIAMFTSIGIHAALFLLFFFMIAWRPPNPPLPEIGIEVNFGTDNQGTGEVQPKEPIGSQGTQAEEPNQPEPEEDVAETPPPVVETPVEEEVVTTKEESPVVVKEDKKVETPQPEKVVEKTPPKKQEPVKQTPDPATEYKPKQQTESANTTTEGKAGTAGSHGDDKNKTGDKGNPEGKVDAKSLYGEPGGGGGGPSLELAGWQWDRKPAPAVAKSESGRVVFEIKVDENGEIVNIRTLERSVSLAAEKACREEIQRLTFTKTGSNVPEFSVGKITFVISAK